MKEFSIMVPRYDYYMVEAETMKEALEKFENYDGDREEMHNYSKTSEDYENIEIDGVHRKFVEKGGKKEKEKTGENKTV